MRKRYIILILILIILFSVMGIKMHRQFKTIETNKIIDEILSENQETVQEEQEDIIKEPEISTINIIAAGDIMFHSPQFKAAYNSKSGEYDFNSVFEYIKPYAEGADIALANFETVTAGKDIEFQGFPRFNTPKESLLGIRNAGFDILSTANNHSLDHGKKGLINTLDNMEEYSLKNIGTYKEPNSKILIEEINQIKVGLLSYTYGVNGMDHTLTKEELEYMINIIDEDRIYNDIKKSKSLGADIIIVFIHWGNEYHREPSEYQIDLGQKMVDWGANIVLGSHPHVIQRSEIIRSNGQDNFIIYSMGNFLSNQRSELMKNKYTEDGIMIEFEIEKDLLEDKTIIKNIGYIPTWVHRYRNEGRLFYEILPIEKILEGNIDIYEYDKIKLRLEESYNDTMNQMTEY